MYSFGKTGSEISSQAREINSNKELTIIRLRNFSRKECWTIMYGVITGPFISIPFSWIQWLSSPDFAGGTCSKQPSSKPVRRTRPTTLKSKISSMSTIETRPFWLHSCILWKEVYKNTRRMSIVLVVNVIWRSGHAIRSSILLDFPFFTI